MFSRKKSCFEMVQEIHILHVFQEIQVFYMFQEICMFSICSRKFMCVPRVSGNSRVCICSMKVFYVFEMFVLLMSKRNLTVWSWGRVPEKFVRFL